MVIQPLERVRTLTADELGIGAEYAIADHSSSRPDDPGLEDDDPHYLEVISLLDYFGGVIFTGPPGTSKTWYAAQIGTKLVDGDRDRIRFVQFHPSYQYEDFIQGFVPREDGNGFELKEKLFLDLCRRASADGTKRYVLVIDELSRGDPGRIFGEALTYIERSKRGLPFLLASGRASVVPENLVVLATMNPLDRGVDEVDAAFERRFAKIAMDPDRNILQSILDINGVTEPLRRRITGFFDLANGRAKTTPQAAIGHTYFTDVRDEESLWRVWNHQLKFLVDKAYRLDPSARVEIAEAFERIFRSTPKESEPNVTQPEPGVKT